MTGRTGPGRDAGAPRSVAEPAPSLGATRRPDTGRVRERVARDAPVAVRRATVADLPTVVELRLALLRENGDHPIYGQLRVDARDRAYDVFGAQLRSPHEVMFLAESEGEVVGIFR